MAYSSGFSPHPRISYANASPTGAATEAEYLEIGLSEVCDPQKVAQALDEALPPGMSILGVSLGGGPSLTELLVASKWEIELAGADATAIASAVAALLAADEVEVQRMTKSGIRSFDVRAAIVDLASDGTKLWLTSRQTTPLTRPDDVVSALVKLEPGLVLANPPMLKRLSQGPLVDGEIGDPFADD